MPFPNPISQTSELCPKTPVPCTLPANSIKSSNRTRNIIIVGLHDMAAQVPNRFLDAINRFFDALAYRLTTRRKQRLDVRILSDRQLADIGLSRRDFHHTPEKPAHWNFHLKN
ncbi:DUF1127 domain-containing protein [Thalassospira sp. TSL5-1]|uniref:DUF1127 domain-containing protein n=1 Tax=Thalassospira sp. TSL5-1 TaxID=1544451 RepID=UPI00093B8560|nr:DUF1127 domain-containing protein [Thalassospira sp. TSL5-1]OKH87033.1 hypothetical protein LF95_18735 [Thalassospira sp. TSL5-1]